MRRNRLALEKWAQCRVAGREPDAKKILDDFERVLSDAADERPLQTFFASFPIALAPLAPAGVMSGASIGLSWAQNLCQTS